MHDAKFGLPVGGRHGRGRTPSQISPAATAKASAMRSHTAVFYSVASEGKRSVGPLTPQWSLAGTPPATE
jgi:hypothetical protein